MDDVSNLFVTEAGIEIRFSNHRNLNCDLTFTIYSRAMTKVVSGIRAEAISDSLFNIRDLEKANLDVGELYYIALDSEKKGEDVKTRSFIWGGKKAVLAVLGQIEYGRQDHSIMELSTEDIIYSRSYIAAIKALLIRLRRFKRGKYNRVQGYVGIPYEYAANDWLCFSQLVKEGAIALCRSLNSRYLLSILETYQDCGSQTERLVAGPICTWFALERQYSSISNIKWTLPKLKKNTSLQANMWDGLKTYRIERDDSLQIFFDRVLPLIEKQSPESCLAAELVSRYLYQEATTLNHIVNSSPFLKSNVTFMISKTKNILSLQWKNSLKSRKEIFSSDKLARSSTAIYLHVGAPKTGSSMIQKSLLRLRTILSKYGYYYPEHGLDKNGISGGHSQFGSCLLKGDIDGAATVFNSYLETSKSNSNRLVLSAESLYKFPHEIKSIIGDNQVKVILFHRDAFDSLVSSYNQLVKRHYYSKPFDDYFRAHATDALNSVSIIDEWKAAFGDENIELIYYDREYYQSCNIVSEFLDLIGLDKSLTSRLTNNEKVNRSYTAEALELKRLCNSVLKPAKDGKIAGRLDLILQRYSDTQEKIDNSNAALLKYRPGMMKEYGGYTQWLHTTFSLDELEKKKTEVRSVDNEHEINSAYSLSRLVGMIQAEADIYERLHDYWIEGIKLKGRDEKLVKLGHILQFDWGQVDTPYQDPMSMLNIQAVLNERAELPDVLRELAVSYEKLGDNKQALAIATRALEKRPEGPAIQVIHQRLYKKVYGKERDGK